VKRFPFVDQSLQKQPAREESRTQPKVPAANLEMAKKNRERISVMLSTIK
jgi:hypothetical protein